MFEIETLNYLKYYSTLDLDFESVAPNDLACTKEKVNKIIWKIIQCQNMIGLIREPSNKKGVHLKIFCKIKCDICRFVFDDDIRYSADSKRNKEFINIIFDTKKGY
jgi:hypothetical protein